MCYPVCGLVHIKELLLLIRKSSPCSGTVGFLLYLSEWFFTIYIYIYIYITLYTSEYIQHELLTH